MLLLACSTAAPPAEREPSPDEPAVELDPLILPGAPPGVPESVTSCVEDYRRIAGAPFPARAPSQSFDAWWAGPFQDWVAHYNGVRERCDAIQAELPEDGPGTQVMWGAQSAMHERLGQAAIPLEEHAQMFMMGRYWTLGAACTFERCAAGPDAGWSAFCREHGGRLPACPSADGPTPPGE